MILRLWSLVILACVGAFAPSRACARTAETRTWDFFAATANARPESAAQVADSHLGNLACGYEFAPGYSQAAESRAITSGSQVTEQTIRAAMKDAPLTSQQAGGVSLPKVQQYVDKLLAGEVAPAIKVDAGMVVDGNHRYIARRILGQEPAVQPWLGGRPGSGIPWDKIPIDPNPW